MVHVCKCFSRPIRGYSPTLDWGIPPYQPWKHTSALLRIFKSLQHVCKSAKWKTWSSMSVTCHLFTEVKLNLPESDDGKWYRTSHFSLCAFYRHVAKIWKSSVSALQHVVYATDDMIHHQTHKLLHTNCYSTNATKFYALPPFCSPRYHILSPFSIKKP